MNPFKRPEAVSGSRHDEDLDPDRLDQLLADLEKQLESLPPDIPTTNELRQEIETLRAMIETVSSNKDWGSEERRAIRTTAQRIAERLKGIS
jgi:uncharacterized protein involved in exopolysaccharide biosynthesis